MLAIQKAVIFILDSLSKTLADPYAHSAAVRMSEEVRKEAETMDQEYDKFGFQPEQNQEEEAGEAVEEKKDPSFADPNGDEGQKNSALTANE